MSESSDCHLIDGLVCVCDLSATEDILGFLLFFKLAVFIRWPLLTGENQNQIQTIWRFRLGFFEFLESDVLIRIQLFDY
jgi:hypothetical protein